MTKMSKNVKIYKSQTLVNNGKTLYIMQKNNFVWSMNYCHYFNPWRQCSSIFYDF